MAIEFSSEPECILVNVGFRYTYYWPETCQSSLISMKTEFSSGPDGTLVNVSFIHKNFLPGR